MGEMHNAKISLLLILVQLHFGTCILAWHCAAESARRAVVNLKWRKAVFIHDNDNAGITQAVQDIELLIYQINNETILETMLYEINAQLFPDLNVIVVLNQAMLLTKVIKEADGFDVKSNHSADWWHHSKWLVYTTESQLVRGGLKVDNLQDIAILLYSLTTSGCSVHAFTLQSDNSKKRFEQVDETVPLRLQMFPNTPYRYNRRPLRISTVNSNPCSMISESPEKDGIPLRGFCIDVIRMIAGHLNMTLKYVEPRGGVWGWIEDGMMGQLKRRELDVVADLMSVNVARAKHVDFIMPFLLPGEVELLYKMPPANNPILLLARPFQAWVYVTYLATTCMVVTMLIIIQTFGKFSTSSQRKSAWGVIKLFWMQEDRFQHISEPGRFLLAFWWLLFVILASLYTCNLTATLTANSPLKKFRNLEEVLNSDFVVGYWPGGILDTHLKSSEQINIKRLHDKIKRVNKTDSRVTSSSLDYHIKRVTERKYMYLGYNINMEVFRNRDCNLSRLLVEGVPQEPITFAVQKNSPFKDDINKVMGDLKSRGIVKMLWEKWNQQNTTGACSPTRNSITIKEIIGAIVVIGAGGGLSLVFLALEMMSVRFKRSDLHFVKGVSQT